MVLSSTSVNVTNFPRSFSSLSSMLLNSITHEFVSIVNVNILKIFDALGDIFDRSRNAIT